MRIQNRYNHRNILMNKKDTKTKSLKILGIPVWQSTKSADKQYRRLFGIPYWSSKTKNGKKKKYCLGIRYSNKKQGFSPLEQGFFSSISRQSLDTLNYIKTQNSSFTDNFHQAIEEAKLHNATFSKYKSIHAGQDIVLTATGPTINFYTPLPNAVHIGVNKAMMLKQIRLDYLFMQDYFAITDYIEQAANIDCKKFYGIIPPPAAPTLIIPESIAQRHKAERYYVEVMIGRTLDGLLPHDISAHPFKDWGSVILPAAQFALYTNPRRIYLAGCDTSNSGYFDNSEPKFPLGVDSVIYGWNKVKEMAAFLYPETEIISINPVGLKGMFKDVYTKEYLSAHPEINPDEVEILE